MASFDLVLDDDGADDEEESKGAVAAAVFSEEEDREAAEEDEAVLRGCIRGRRDRASWALQARRGDMNWGGRLVEIRLEHLRGEILPWSGQRPTMQELEERRRLVSKPRGVDGLRQEESQKMLTG